MGRKALFACVRRRKIPTTTTPVFYFVHTQARNLNGNWFSDISSLSKNCVCGFFPKNIYFGLTWLFIIIYVTLVKGKSITRTLYTYSDSFGGKITFCCQNIIFLKTTTNLKNLLYFKNIIKVWKHVYIKALVISTVVSVWDAEILHLIFHPNIISSCLSDLQPTHVPPPQTSDKVCFRSPTLASAARFFKAIHWTWSLNPPDAYI